MNINSIVQGVFLLFLVGLINTGVASAAEKINFWHSNTVFEGRGSCAATFIFDSGMNALKNLEVSFSVLDEKGLEIKKDTLKVQEFGQAMVNKYADAMVSGEEYCRDNLSILVNSAVATVEGQNLDLLEADLLRVRDFKPFKITISQ